jgi:deoxyribodipyrimidine photolyase-related protein
MTTFLILPIHLFHHDILLKALKTIEPPVKQIIMLEEPTYYGHHYMEMNYNKLKLIYHRATMQYYKDYIVKHLPSDIVLEYIEHKNLMKTSSRTGGYASIKKSSSGKIKLFNPVDMFLEAKYKKLFGANGIEYLETPLFFCTTKDLADYDATKTSKKSYNHASFYTWQRQRMGILEGSKTYDTENRNMMPISTKVPALPENDSANSATRKYLDEAISYTQKNWPGNLEPVYVQMKTRAITPESIHFPITHETARAWVHEFCKTRFSSFGKYEDSIDSIPRNFLFHSCITPMLNIGLITPLQVVDIITTYYKAHKTAIGIANYEGFIRQIIGWREYQRYIYVYAGETMRAGNHFGNSRRLNNTWYTASTGLKPVDDSVRMALDDGYIHHILRLMVVGNFMNLVGVHPDDVYKWFMEFALDSYDWVMVGNVYSMTLWADGGMTMRKPYISGDGYIMKMGNFPSSRGSSSKRTKKQIDRKNKEDTKEDAKYDTKHDTKEDTKEDAKHDTKDITWNEEWNSVFHHFINRNADKLLKTYYAGLVRAWQKKPEDQRRSELEIANKVITRLS